MVRIHQAREARAHDLLPPSSAVGVLPLGRAVLVKGFGYRPGRSCARSEGRRPKPFTRADSQCGYQGSDFIY